jgi:hypothetical protein
MIPSLQNVPSGDSNISNANVTPAISNMENTD